MPDQNSAVRGPQELPIPTEASTAPQARKVLRAWIVESGLQVSTISGFDRPEIWGMLLADVARHAARAFQADGICQADEAFERIVGMMSAQLGNPTDEGSTAPIRRQ